MNIVGVSLCSPKAGEMADILQDLLMKMIVFWINHNKHLFLTVRLTASQHLFMLWFGADAANNYVNQWRSALLSHMCFTRPQTNFLLTNLFEDDCHTTNDNSKIWIHLSSLVGELGFIANLNTSRPSYTYTRRDRNLLSKIVSWLGQHTVYRELHIRHHIVCRRLHMILVSVIRYLSHHGNFVSRHR